MNTKEYVTTACYYYYYYSKYAPQSHKNGNITTSQVFFKLSEFPVHPTLLNAFHV